jgi:serine phosphatase RsbU (regulator of sigma subunit)
VDLQDGTFRFAGAGGPQVLLVRADGTHECIESQGLPLAVLEDAPYETVSTAVGPGDRLLLFSDGAVEVTNAAGEMLGVDGLVGILKNHGYPQADVEMEALEEELLKYSNAIRLEDDLTIVEVCFRPNGRK